MHFMLLRLEIRIFDYTSLNMHFCALRTSCLKIRALGMKLRDRDADSE